MFLVGLENNTEGRSQAWVLGHPGCFAYGADGDTALQAVPRAIQEYRRWIASRTSENWFPDDGDDYHLEDCWDCYSIDDEYNDVKDGYEVNAWFRHDWKPLEVKDVGRGLLLLQWGRDELIHTVGGLNTEVLSRTYPHERWSITGILQHVASAEWWYLGRLGLSYPLDATPTDPFEHLDKVRAHLAEVLPGLVGSRQVVGLSGEFWSPRKLLRRAVWHEYDHIAHIRKLL